jgi:hypothetical protein
MGEEQSVVVTGVSTGIGWGITKVLIANGFTVFGCQQNMSVQLWLDVCHEFSTIRPRGADTGTAPYPLCSLLMSCEIRHAGQVQQRSKKR